MSSQFGGSVPAGLRGPRRWLPVAARHPSWLVVLGLGALIAVGTGTLALPVATASGRSAPLRVALFTATSAASDTGLSVVDTGTYWSPFGQAVLAVLMQTGGLALMASASLLGLVVAGRLGLRSRLLARTPIHRIVLGTIVLGAVVELAVLLVLAARLWLHYGESAGRALWLGTFHAVAAFDNGGLSLWPTSLAAYAADPWVVLPIALAVIVGGLGFPVMLEVTRVRSIRQWSVHTRLTLVVTGVLLVAGPVIVTLVEWNNPGTLGALDAPGRLIAGFFSGIGPRSSGLHTIDYAQADPSTQLFTDTLMVIGGASGGTAGGIKVTTIAVLVLAVVAELRGDVDVDVLDRRITATTVRQAIAVCAMAFALVAAAAFVLLLLLTREGIGDVLFEVASAFGTVGLSTGLTARLPALGQYVLVVLMIVGRVGPITLATSLALRHGRRMYRNPQARPLIG